MNVSPNPLASFVELDEDELNSLVEQWRDVVPLDDPRPLIACAYALELHGKEHPLGPPGGHRSYKSTIDWLVEFLEAAPAHRGRSFQWHLTRYALLGRGRPEACAWIRATSGEGDAFALAGVRLVPRVDASMLLPHVLHHLGDVAAVTFLAHNVDAFERLRDVGALVVALARMLAADERSHGVGDLLGRLAKRLDGPSLVLVLAAIAPALDRQCRDEYARMNAWAHFQLEGLAVEPLVERAFGGRRDATVPDGLTAAASASPGVAWAVGRTLGAGQLLGRLVAEDANGVRALLAACPAAVSALLAERRPHERSGSDEELRAVFAGEARFLDVALPPGERLVLLVLVGTPAAGEGVVAILRDARAPLDAGLIAWAADHTRDLVPAAALVERAARDCLVALEKSARLRAFATRHEPSRDVLLGADPLRLVDEAPTVAMAVLGGRDTALAALDDEDRLSRLPLLVAIKTEAAFARTSPCLTPWADLWNEGRAPYVSRHHPLMRASTEWLARWHGAGILPLDAVRDVLAAQVRGRNLFDDETDGGHPSSSGAIPAALARDLIDLLVGETETTSAGDLGRARLFGACAAHALRGGSLDVPSLAEKLQAFLGERTFVAEWVATAFFRAIPAAEWPDVVRRLLDEVPEDVASRLRSRRWDDETALDALRSLAGEALSRRRPPLAGLPRDTTLDPRPWRRAIATLLGEAARDEAPDDAALGDDDLDACWDAVATEVAARAAAPAVDSHLAERLVRTAGRAVVRALARRLDDATLSAVRDALGTHYPTRPRLEQALAAAGVGAVGKVADAAADERLPKLLRDALAAVLTHRVEHWSESDDAPVTLAAAVVDAVFAACANHPAMPARPLVDVLAEHGDARAGVDVMRGMMFALGDLREPLGGRPSKVLLGLSRNDDLPDALRHAAETQKRLFDRDNLNKGRFRKAEARTAKALESIRVGSQRTAAS